MGRRKVNLAACGILSTLQRRVRKDLGIHIFFNAFEKFIVSKLRVCRYKEEDKIYFRKEDIF